MGEIGSPGPPEFVRFGCISCICLACDLNEQPKASESDEDQQAYLDCLVQSVWSRSGRPRAFLAAGVTDDIDRRKAAEQSQDKYPWRYILHDRLPGVLRERLAIGDLQHLLARVGRIRRVLHIALHFLGGIIRVDGLRRNDPQKDHADEDGKETHHEISDEPGPHSAGSLMTVAYLPRRERRGPPTRGVDAVWSGILR